MDSQRRYRRLLAEQLEDRSLLAVTFAPPVDYPAGTYPNSVAVGDFNGDGQDDLATAHDEVVGSTVSVLLNDGDGTFGPKTDYTVGGWMYSVVAGDFNGDGRDDLATANSSDGDGVGAVEQRGRDVRLEDQLPGRAAPRSRWRWGTSTGTAKTTSPPPTFRVITSRCC